MSGSFHHRIAGLSFPSDWRPKCQARNCGKAVGYICEYDIMRKGRPAASTEICRKQAELYRLSVEKLQRELIKLESGYIHLFKENCVNSTILKRMSQLWKELSSKPWGSLTSDSAKIYCEIHAKAFAARHEIDISTAPIINYYEIDKSDRDNWAFTINRQSAIINHK